MSKNSLKLVTARFSNVCLCVWLLMCLISLNFSFILIFKMLNIMYNNVCVFNVWLCSFVCESLIIDSKFSQPVNYLYVQYPVIFMRELTRPCCLTMKIPINSNLFVFCMQSILHSDIHRHFRKAYASPQKINDGTLDALLFSVVLFLHYRTAHQNPDFYKIL